MRCKENANVSGTLPAAHLCPLPVGLTLGGGGLGVGETTEGSAFRPAESQDGGEGSRLEARVGAGLVVPLLREGLGHR